MVQLGAGHWQHVPLGDPHDDRYLPLHPQLVELIGECRTRHVHPDNHLLLPGKRLDTYLCSTRTIQCGEIRGRPPRRDNLAPARSPSMSPYSHALTCAVR